MPKPSNAASSHFEWSGSSRSCSTAGPQSKVVCQSLAGNGRATMIGLLKRARELPFSVNKLFHQNAIKAANAPGPVSDRQIAKRNCGRIRFARQADREFCVGDGNSGRSLDHLRGYSGQSSRFEMRARGKRLGDGSGLRYAGVRSGRNYRSTFWNSGRRRNSLVLYFNVRYRLPVDQAKPCSIRYGVVAAAGSYGFGNNHPRD